MPAGPERLLARIAQKPRFGLTPLRVKAQDFVVTKFHACFVNHDNDLNNAEATWWFISSGYFRSGKWGPCLLTFFFADVAEQYFSYWTTKMRRSTSTWQDFHVRLSVPWELKAIGYKTRKLANFTNAQRLQRRWSRGHFASIYIYHQFLSLLEHNLESKLGI